MGAKKSTIYYVDRSEPLGITAANAKPSSSRDSIVIRSHSNMNVNNARPLRKAIQKSASDPQREKLVLKEVHLSSASDVYRGENNNYAGYILYSHDGQTKWKLNGRECEIGLLVIKDTGKEGVRRHMGSTEGVVHGAVYKSVFDEDVGNTVGEGFSVCKGEFKWESGTFNARQDSFHDDKRRISEVAELCVSKVLKTWMKAGEEYQHLPSKRKYAVKELL